MSKYINFTYITVISWLCEIQLLLYLDVLLRHCTSIYTYVWSPWIHRYYIVYLSNKEYQSNSSTKKTTFFAAQWYGLQFLFSFIAVADSHPLLQELLPVPVPPHISWLLRISSERPRKSAFVSAALPLVEHVQCNINSLWCCPLSLLHRDEPELFGRLRGRGLHGTLSSVRAGKASLGREQLRWLFGGRYQMRLFEINLTSVLVWCLGIVGNSTFLVLLTDQVFVTASIWWRACWFMGIFCVNPVREDFRWEVEWLDRAQSL